MPLVQMYQAYVEDLAYSRALAFVIVVVRLVLCLSTRVGMVELRDLSHGRTMALFARSFTGAGRAVKLPSISSLAWNRLELRPGTATMATFEISGLFCMGDMSICERRSL